MSDSYEVNGEVVSTYDKSAFDDYRSKWTRDPEVEEVDEDNLMVPQYEKYFPAAGEYPSEVYEATGCLSPDEALDRVSVGDTILVWNGPPTNENAYLVTGKVKRLPGFEMPRPAKDSIWTDEHFQLTYGQVDRNGGLLGEMRSYERIDCVVEVNPEVADE
ncbi:hypothetical protein DNAM5_80 [Haloarcula californiae tailed virus 1]|uniref:Uncharacterized protein n=1 Tax=Haloarcula californiae tailed virus 1 TaxID=1273746 RepID=R4TAI5_9CAUD|nr:hypothetical protein M202_gp138 [Haloarcula californiae tailed virus 1]AGM11940.1 hypothetical protein DNAM5_80 [Haloarcula californiae tailed virus 1]